MNNAIDDILEFWFAPDVKDRWWDKDPKFDQTIRDRFLDLHEAACNGDCADWTETARGCLALVLLLDQFPRNMFRDTARAFATDADARAITNKALAAGLDDSLPPDQRMFLYIPLEHSEDMADQDRSVALMAGLGNPQTDDYAKAHRELIARFGRFPHRNAVLGRTSTPEEEIYLADPDAGF